MKKIISIILTLTIITSCIAIGIISSSAATSMKIRARANDSVLYEGMESKIRISFLITKIIHYGKSFYTE